MATSRFIARKDASLEARVTGCVEMIYADGPSDDDDRPPHVLAASGLSIFREYLAVVQDDANWLALIDPDQRVSAIPLPCGPGGKRVFTKARGNQADKLDFEACISVTGEQGLELIGFASGSRNGREWILRVREIRDAAGDGGSPGSKPVKLDAEFIGVQSFYAALRQQTEFCGCGLNIEGAVALEGERIILFQRGNARPSGGLEPTDATAELSWPDLRAYLDNPQAAAPPTLRNIRTYELGELEGTRLTFSDAEDLGDERILYSASAEDPATGDVTGSILGVLERGGEARWTDLTDADGELFKGKIEGLTRDVHDRCKIHFVIDDDDDEVPSKIYQAHLGQGFLAP